MKSDVFDPKAGSLEIEFSDGSSYSLPLSKTYHREETFYVDLFWEEDKSGTSLSLALHPKAENLVLNLCKLLWPLASGFPTEVFTQGFTEPMPSMWMTPQPSGEVLGFLKKSALKKMNAYDPLPHPSKAKASYQSIRLRDKKLQIEIKSIDESAALTVFSLAQNSASLCAENQSFGYKLRHSFPAFELRFSSKNAREKSKPKSIIPVFSIAVSPAWTEHSALADLTNTSLLEEGNFKNIVIQHHESPCPGQTGFDESLYSAFAKTCVRANLQAGITLSPFVVTAGASAAGLFIAQEVKYRRWSPSTNRWIYPIDLSHEDSVRTCEQHLLRFYRLGYRLFVLNDIALSLRDGAGTTTTGQQLNQRLDLLKRILPEATIILGDLSNAELFEGFQGFQATRPHRSQLPALARFAGLGLTSLDYGKLAPYRIPSISFESPTGGDSAEMHTFLDLSSEKFHVRTLVALESTLGSFSYPT